MVDDDTSAPDWSEQNCRVYARYMDTNARHDHRKVARRIVQDWPEIPAGATVVEVASGPAVLLLELAGALERAQLIATDASPTMIQLARERAASRGVQIETHVCPAETLALPDACAELVVCKHFLRLADDVDAVLSEMARVLVPGGRAYLVDFDADRPWLAARLLHLWILLTAPAFIRDQFWDTMQRGMPASSLLSRLRHAGFASASVLSTGVSYMVRGIR